MDACLTEKQHSKIYDNLNQNSSTDYKEDKDR